MMIRKMYLLLGALFLVCLPLLAQAEDGYIWGDGSASVAIISGVTVTGTHNYSIYIRGQVTPKIVQVAGEDRLNIPALPTYPDTFGRKIYCTQGLDYYSDDLYRRAELWEDSTGTATWADVKLLFPELPGIFETAIRKWGSTYAQQITSPYSEDEQKTWPYQREEVKDWLKDPAALTPYCDRFAARRGIPREIFLQKVRENVDLFEWASTGIFGNQQAMLDLLNYSDSLAEILTAADLLGIKLLEVQ